MPHTERRPTTTETRVTYDNSTWHAMNTRYINSTKLGCLLGDFCTLQSIVCLNAITSHCLFCFGLQQEMVQFWQQPEARSAEFDWLDKWWFTCRILQFSARHNDRMDDQLLYRDKHLRSMALFVFSNSNVRERERERERTTVELLKKKWQGPPKI